MRLRPCAHQLILFAKRKYIIPHDILAPIMLVKPRALAAVDDIALQQDAAAALVRVEAPSAISMRVHIVDQVVANDRSWLRPERVDRTHVAQPELADIMHMVELDSIF